MLCDSWRDGMLQLLAEEFVDDVGQSDTIVVKNISRRAPDPQLTAMVEYFGAIESRVLSGGRRSSNGKKSVIAR